MSSLMLLLVVMMAVEHCYAVPHIFVKNLKKNLKKNLEIGWEERLKKNYF